MKQKLSGNGDACSRGGAYIILSCLPVLLVLVIAFLIVCNADFELSDDCELLVSVCSGIPHPGLLYQNTSGRFNWSRSEYNFLLLTPFNDSPAAFYAVSAFQYLVFSSFTLLLLRDAVKRTNTVSGRLVLLGIWLTLHFGTHWTFFCLVQPERLQITLLAAFCYFLLRARETDRRRYWTASLALAAVTTYCKEPMFGAFLVLGVHILLLFRGNKKARLFSFGLFASAVLYLTLYMLIVFPNITGLYAPNGTARSATVVSKAAAMLEALRNSPLLAVCMLLALIIMARNVLCLCRRLIHKTGLSNYANKSYPPPLHGGCPPYHGGCLCRRHSPYRRDDTILLLPDAHAVISCPAPPCAGILHPGQAVTDRCACARRADSGLLRPLHCGHGHPQGQVRAPGDE